MARAAATGGGTTYRGQMPVNWYAALVIIVLVGLGSVALAKYNYNSNAPCGATDDEHDVARRTGHRHLRHHRAGPPGESCRAPPRAHFVRAAGSSSFRRAAPARPGRTRRSGKFASGYTGLTLTNTTIQYPHGVLYQNGERCAKGTPDAGKVGEVRARWWVLSTQTGKNGEPQQVGGLNTVQPGNLRFTNRQVITAFFGPDNATIPQAAVLDRQLAGPDSGRERAGRHHDHGSGHDHHGAERGDVDHGADLGVFDHDHEAHRVVHYDHLQILDNLHDQVAMTG